MKVEIRLSKEIAEPYVVIHTDEITDEIAQMVKRIEDMKPKVITAKIDDRLVILQPEEIYMVRVEDEKTFLYGERERYLSRKRLYELEEDMGEGFLRISKSTLVNLKYLDSVEPSFSGVMLLRLKNQCQEYVSRKYLPDLKRYLGL